MINANHLRIGTSTIQTARLRRVCFKAILVDSEGQETKGVTLCLFKGLSDRFWPRVGRSSFERNISHPVDESPI